MSSSAKKGASRVGGVMTSFAKLGFRCARTSASGQRRGARQGENMIAGDLIALAPVDSGFPHVIIEVGGVGKVVTAAFDELLEFPLPPGFIAMVIRFVKRKRRYYLDADSRFESLTEALEASREA